MADSPRFTRHMSDEDALMWIIEKDPILRSTIVAVALFDRPPDFDRLRARIDRATCLIPRFRQRVLSPPFRVGPPRWSVESTFDLDFHLRRMRLPAPGTERTLLDALQPMASAGIRPGAPVVGVHADRRPLRRRRHRTRRVRDEGAPHRDRRRGRHGAARAARRPHRRRDRARPTRRPRPRPRSMDARALMRESLVHSSRRIARRRPPPAGTGGARRARDDARSGARGQRARRAPRARSVGSSHRRMEPMSPVMRDRGLGRRLDVFDLPLDDLRRAAKATEGSLNDVFVAAILGGLHRYHERHGECPDSLRMTLPINLRREGDDVGRQPLRTRALRGAGNDRRSPRAGAGGPALVQQWRAEPALQLTGQLAGVSEPPSDRDHDGTVRRHAEVLRLRRDQRARRAGARVRRRRPRRAPLRLRAARRARP